MLLSESPSGLRLFFLWTFYRVFAQIHYYLNEMAHLSPTPTFFFKRHLLLKVLKCHRAVKSSVIPFRRLLEWRICKAFIPAARDTKVTKGHFPPLCFIPPHPPHPPLLSLRECERGPTRKVTNAFDCLSGGFAHTPPPPPTDNC